VSKKTSPTSVRFSKAVDADLRAAKRATKLPKVQLIEMSIERGLPILLQALGVSLSSK
jgi:hypothetical protein